MNDSKQAGRPLGLTRALPCPICGADVGNLAFEASEPSRSAATLAVDEFQRRRYILKPCGHDVAGYDTDAFGKMLRWHP